MKGLNILIIEDESILALNLSLQLKEAGFHVVDNATNFEDAFSLLKQHSEINLLIMDIHLNDKIDGVDFYKQLNEKIPVIYLTAYTDDQTINKAIETQPLGYLAKPLNERELFALLKLAALKRKPLQTSKENLLTLPNNYIFDREHDILTHNGQRVKINGKKLQLLKLLIEAKGEYIPFEIIEDELYKDNPPSESSLRTLVYRLRSQLGYDFIETQRAYGIRLSMQNSS
ncbi:response regulator [Sulfurimonas marina]|uniref:Response regulator n=1 Tax=Sulfurimonas marina TaxID=2590551 RepID=A0A7M1AW93_9BACT|nr:response regulator [Sulfurimonas marina]QOP41727.1 response regulator [Sulfurimonas marina]